MKVPSTVDRLDVKLGCANSPPCEPPGEDTVLLKHPRDGRRVGIYRHLALAKDIGVPCLETVQNREELFLVVGVVLLCVGQGLAEVRNHIR